MILNDLNDLMISRLRAADFSSEIGRWGNRKWASALCGCSLFFVPKKTLQISPLGVIKYSRFAPSGSSPQA